MLTPQQKLSRRIRHLSVAEKYPSLVDQWSSTNYFGPDLFGPRSQELINWTCKKGHKFVAPIAKRVQAIEQGYPSEGCPMCLGGIPLFKDSLAFTHPHLVLEWQTLRNSGIEPNEMHGDWDFPAYWRCPNEGHVFRTRVSARTRQPHPQGCPYCYKGPRVNAALTPGGRVRFETSSLNYGFDPACLPASYLVYWRCARADHLLYQSATQLRDHEWQCSICLTETNCKYLADLPELMKQLVSMEDKETNPDRIRCGSHKKATWQCPAGVDHIWTTPIYTRALHNEGCPFCENRRPSVTNSLANFPDLATELHPHKNGGLTAATVVARTKRILWWLCSGCGHEWEKAAFLRTLRCSPCPKCKSRALRRKRRQELQAVPQDKTINQKAAE